MKGNQLKLKARTVFVYKNKTQTAAKSETDPTMTIYTTVITSGRPGMIR